MSKNRKGESRKRFIMCLIAVVCVAGMASIAVAASQDKYGLPEPYLTWEKGFLQISHHCKASWIP